MARKPLTPEQREEAKRERRELADIWLADWANINGIRRDLCRMAVRDVGTPEQRELLRRLEEQR